MTMRGLSEPDHAFTIPSLHDGKLLECRLYLPKHHKHVQQHAAIIAHPYAPLGGSFDDPVVSIVGAEILRHGWPVMTFNFRGAGGSQGRTSWTGSAECTDYASVAGFLIKYLESRQSNETNKNMSLIFAGYSYGSMIVVNSPPLPSILAPFGSSDLSQAASEIVSRAEFLAKEADEQVSTSDNGHLAVLSVSQRRSFDHIQSIGGDNHGSAAAQSNAERDQQHQGIIESISCKLHTHKNTAREHQSRNSTDKTAWTGCDVADAHIYYLLISPLLPPISTLTALPVSLHGRQSNNERKLETCPTLAIYGEQDGFTSSKKLDIWVQNSASINEHFQGVKIARASHFWREQGTSQELIRNISNWITKLSPNTDVS